MYDVCRDTASVHFIHILCFVKKVTMKTTCVWNHNDFKNTLQSLGTKTGRAENERYCEFPNWVYPGTKTL